MQKKKTQYSMKVPLLIITLAAFALFLVYLGIHSTVQDRFSLVYVELPEENAYAVSGCTKATDALTIPARYQEKPVSCVLSDSFANMTVQTLTLEGAAHIQARAFRNCISLTQAQLGNALSIGDNAFEFCRSLGSITIPESVTSIGKRAFSFCDVLQEVRFLADPADLGENIFEFCPNVVIYGTPGGNIEAYCSEYGLEFRSLPEETKNGAAD